MSSILTSRGFRAAPLLLVALLAYSSPQLCFSATDEDESDVFAVELLQDSYPAQRDSSASSPVANAIAADEAASGETITNSAADRESSHADHEAGGTKPVPVAEPTSMGMLIVGMIFLFFLARSRRFSVKG